MNWLLGLAPRDRLFYRPRSGPLQRIADRNGADGTERNGNLLGHINVYRFAFEIRKGHGLRVKSSTIKPWEASAHIKRGIRDEV